MRKDHDLAAVTIQSRVFALTLASVLAASASPALATDLIINATVGDFNGDGSQDLATLIIDDDGDVTQIGMEIYLRDNERDVLTQEVSAKNLFWGSASNRALRGMEPTISTAPNGSILVHTKNDAVGRNRWDQTVTIAYRDGAFVVAGFTYSYRDTLARSDTGQCDINLLTGIGVRNRKPLTTRPRRVQIENWDSKIWLRACGVEG